MVFSSYRISNLFEGVISATSSAEQTCAPLGDLKCNEFVSDGLTWLFNSTHQARF